MIHKLQDYFEYSKGERNGIAVLLLLLLISFGILPYFYSSFKSKEEFNFNTFKSTIQDFQSNQASADKTPTNTRLFAFDPNSATKEEFEQLGLSPKLANTIINYRNKGGKFYKNDDFKKMYGLKTEDFDRLAPFIALNDFRSKNKFYPKKKTLDEEKNIEYFIFNPNTASQTDFEILGLSKKVAQTIIKFREKGGHFYKKDDFKKIYTLKEEDFNRLVPYIEIPQQEKKIAKKEKHIPKSYNNFTPKKVSKSIDINTASIEDFQQLNGIGPGYAKRIVKYRTTLGGFYTIQQIAETYGLPDSTYQKVKPFLKLNTPNDNKININTTTVDALKKHPYINYKQAKAIVNYRKQHGKFTDINQLQKIRALNTESLKKITPYVAID